ncbi:hypothetical protein VitviT2T_021431 [Vitis vinifera]|uniref:NB-ARC domain-containing protein n=1 Tax=Vitis vinifera TaxID=29760 RepID=A0ABY9D9S9_VITVI|nr:hypothetical protein VitviT2T_021431 [Vitis vinifera]
MAEIAIAIATKVVEYLVAPIGRPFGYLFNYRSNIDNLVHQVEKLGDVRAGLQRSVDEAIKNGDEIEADVDKWLMPANGFMEEARKFLEDGKKANKSCFMGLCPNLKLHYKLSRAAKKKARAVVEIQGARKFERLSYRAPLPRIGSTTLRGYEALELRMSTLNQIMEALRDGDDNMIGVWGMGGVGTTTLVEQVAKHAKEQKLFDEVVMASVFQNPDLRKIQGQLADMIGLKFEESEWGKAARLNEDIKKEKKILIILGIPFGDKHVLSNEMGTQKDIPVLHLPKKEALVLFKKIVGDSIDKQDLQAIVINVAKDCAGLPIALETIAKALKNKNVSIWKNALQQLKRSMPTNIRGMDAMVYSSLELSYKHLHGDETKSLFLLCGLMDNDIFIDDLLKYVMALRLFQGTDTLKETRNRVEALVDNLKASNVLLETGDNAFTRMHDVVCDVALAIASKDHVFSLREGVGLEEWPKLDELQSCSKISLAYNDIRKLPEGLIAFPSLELLNISGLDNVEKIWHNQLLEDSFSQLKEIRVASYGKLLYFSIQYAEQVTESTVSKSGGL